VAALDTRLERLDERHDDQYDRLTSLEETLLVLAEALLCPEPGVPARGIQEPGGPAPGGPAPGGPAPGGPAPGGPAPGGPAPGGRHVMEPEGRGVGWTELPAPEGRFNGSPETNGR
jgi:hypothetical protein